MPKSFKIIALVVSALVLLVAAAMLLVFTLVDPNDYKGEITAAVQKATGRELTLAGDIKLSLFPWLGLSLGEARLGNAPGFGEQPMASVAAVDIKVKLLPLLTKRVEMDNVRLHGLRVTLQRATDGRTNWRDLLAPPQLAPAKAPTQKTGSGLAALAIGGVELLDARLEWDDRQTGQRVLADHLNLRTSSLTPPLPMDVSLSADLSLAQPPLQNHIDFGARVAVDPARQQLDMDNIQLQIVGLTVTGDLHAAELESTPKVTAQLVLAPFSPRSLAETLGITLPTTADAAVLNKAAATLSVDANADHITMTKLAVTLDDSTLSGNAGISHFDKPVVRFDLALDALDADRYLAPPDTMPPAAPTAALAAPVAAQPPLDMLRELAVDGRIGIAKLKAAKARLTDVQLHLMSKDGQLRLNPASAALYGGRFNGDLAIDARGAVPKLAVETTLAGVKAGPLLKDLLGNDAVLGIASVQAKLSAQGGELNDILKTLGGNARISVENGAVNGVNLGQLLREAYAKIKKLPAPTKTVEQTDFATLSASVTIKKGVVSNRDLKANAPALSVKGAGKVDLPQQRIDYRLTATLLEIPADEAAVLKGLPVPVKITGTFDKPKFALDLKPLLEAKAKEELTHQKKKLKNDTEKKLEEKLKDKLKGLF